MNKYGPKCFICREEIKSPNYLEKDGLVVTNDIFGLIHPYHRVCAVNRFTALFWFWEKLLTFRFDNIRKEWKNRAWYPMDKVSWGVVNTPVYTVITIILSLGLLLLFVMSSYTGELGGFLFGLILGILPLFVILWIRLWSYYKYEKPIKRYYSSRILPYVKREKKSFIERHSFLKERSFYLFLLFSVLTAVGITISLNKPHWFITMLTIISLLLMVIFGYDAFTEWHT